MTAATPPPPLLDADERAAFTETLDENFCVSAGAGAGKTTAIVRRIANLALRRHQQPNVLSRLVVVTYGKLAAEELRVRTRDLVLQQLEPTAAGRQTLLVELRGAFFGTIHSFCLKLIRDHGRFLGLPEHLELLEDKNTHSLWEKFCESDALLALDLPPTLLERVGRHLTFDQLLHLARSFGPDETEAPAGFDPAAQPPPLDFSAAFEDGGGRSKDKTREHQSHLRRWLDDFNAGAAYLQLPGYTGGSGTFLAAVEATLAPYAGWLNAAAGCLAVRIACAFRDYRLDRGLMSYRDQIFWCRELLAQPAVLARLRQRGYIVILDEAQDTDADMFAILTEITRPEGASLGGWPGAAGAASPLPGRFSFVGDDQQAIYSERADLRVYRRYIDAFKAGDGGRYLEFSVTMRCPERVIGVVNGIFGNGRIEQEFVRFRELRPRPTCPAGDAWRLDLGTMEASDKRQSQETRLLQECERVAAFVAAHGRGGLGISRWSELAVIAPRVAWLETAARVFAAHDLPGCLLSQKRIARESPRHSWPAALLHVLVHPWDRFELIGVLREVFAVSDVDLARLHRHAGINGCPGLSFWPRVPGVAVKGKIPSDRLHRALRLLHELRASFPIDSPQQGALPNGLETRDECGTLSRYVGYVLKRTALAARLEVIGEPANCLDPFSAGALRAECAGETLRAWVRSLVVALEDPVSHQPDTPDAVQFLTCQKAKGLEWPVVIPLGMRCEIRARPEQFPRVERQDGRTVIHFSKVTVDSDRRAARTTRAAEEFQRMLYVTFTRARQLLIVPDGSSLYENRGPNFQALAHWEDLELDRLFAAAPLVETPSAKRQPPVTDHGPGWFADNKHVLARAAAVSHQIPQRVLPSGLVHAAARGARQSSSGDATGDLRQPPGSQALVDTADDRLLASEDASLASGGSGDEPLAGIGGIEYGNWWHEVLQHYPWSDADPDQRDAYVRDQLGLIAGAAPWLDRATAELTRLAASTAHADLLAGGEVFLAEMPFSHPRESDCWVEGIMDLVVITRNGGEIWIVDWKTDRRRPSDKTEAAFLSRLAGKYAPQLREYAEVFVRGFQRPVNRLLIYSTELGEIVAVPR